jgi:hypothetical protein
MVVCGAVFCVTQMLFLILLYHVVSCRWPAVSTQEECMLQIAVEWSLFPEIKNTRTLLLTLL